LFTVNPAKTAFDKDINFRLGTLSASFQWTWCWCTGELNYWKQLTVSPQNNIILVYIVPAIVDLVMRAGNYILNGDLDEVRVVENEMALSSLALVG
jgi:hypothetical protein